MIPLSDSASVLLVLLIAALPLAFVGLALFYASFTGTLRISRLFIGALSLAALAAVVYYAIGFAWQGFPGGTSWSLQLGSTNWDWISAQKFFFRGLDWNGTADCFIAAFQILAVGIAALIPWGATSGHWRLRAAFASTVIFAAFVYPVFAHWVWGGGWLAHLGVAFNLGGGFVDPGGAATIQVVGALSALAVIWLLGPRANLPGGNDEPVAGSLHHELYLFLGCLLAFVGWLALNSLGAILYGSLTAVSLLPIEINTLLCASASLLVVVLLAQLRFSKPNAAFYAQGWFAGLVASSAVAAYVKPSSAILVGAVAGILMPTAQWLLSVFCDLDDPAGSVAIHGACALWGLFALGFLSNLPSGQTLAQLVGIGTLIGLMLPILYGVNWLLDKKLVRYCHTDAGLPSTLHVTTATRS